MLWYIIPSCKAVCHSSAQHFINIIIIIIINHLFTVVNYLLIARTHYKIELIKTNLGKSKDSSHIVYNQRHVLQVHPSPDHVLIFLQKEAIVSQLFIISVPKYDALKAHGIQAISHRGCA